MAAAPELAASARERFDAGRHKVLATLRADGAPRVSGVEITFADGELWLGMMPGSRKGADLRRDTRMALHSSSPDPDDDHPSDWLGDAKVAGTAITQDDPEAKARFAGTQAQMPPGAFELFRVDVAELTVIRVGTPPDHLLIETWSTDGGIRRVERR
jgi:hypothetical protein